MTARTWARRQVDLARKIRARLGPPPPSQWDRLATEGVVEAGPGTYGMGHLWVHEYRAVDGRWVGARLRIGSYCSIAPCEIFLNGNHRSDWVSQYPFRTVGSLPGSDEDHGTKGDVVIGSDVWIGNGAVILSGVHIGHGAIVGAHAVVARDVAPYEIVVGNPARPVRRRFDDATVERLIAQSWWEWPAERIAAELPMLCAPPEHG